ncbi:MAG: alpha/beta hydrolase [Clostridium sp.]|nr:alpha/beta hydrolase [Clostridium sp.]
MTQDELRVKFQPIKDALNSCEEGIKVPSLWTVPEGFQQIRTTVKGVPVERLIPENWNGKTIFNMHGGGYVFALMDCYRDASVLYSQVAGNAQVVNLDYRVAPTHMAPAALEDAVTVYQWLLEKGTKSEDIIFIGDSAGGNLVLVTGLYLRDHNIPLPGGMIAISPWASMEPDLDSRKENADNDLLLGNDGMDSNEVYKITYHKNSDIWDPYVSPAYGDYTGMPSLLIQVGSYEMLRDDSILTAEAAKKAGVDVTISIYDKMSHIFQIAVPDIKESKRAWEEVKSFINKVYAR